MVEKDDFARLNAFPAVEVEEDEDGDGSEELGVDFDFESCFKAYSAFTLSISL